MKSSEPPESAVPSRRLASAAMVVGRYSEQVNGRYSAQANFLLSADRAPYEFPPAVTQPFAEQAARSLGFRLVRRVALPDGRAVRIWWIDRGPIAGA